MSELKALNNAHLDERKFNIIYKSSLPIKLRHGVFPGAGGKLMQLIAYESLVSDELMRVKFPPLRDKEADV